MSLLPYLYFSYLQVSDAEIDKVLMEESDPRKALIFIPDITGFTEFVNNTEITHAKHIISEQLEILIDSNEIGLEVSEIEGDAILFYRFGQAPTAAELLAQVQKMFVNFHANLKRYETQRICQCGACSGASNLSLKFVTHYGELVFEQIKTHTKLFGKDLIVAHRLLKNQVPEREYSLITHELIDACSGWVDMKHTAWSDPVEGEETYDFGTAKYCYLPLNELKSHIPEPRIEDFALKGPSRKIMDFEQVVEAPIDLAFNVLSDYAIRHEWMPMLKNSDKLNTKIPKNGQTHRCVINGDDSDPFIIAHNIETNNDVITFKETNQNGVQMIAYTLRKVSPAITRLHVLIFMKMSFIAKLKYDLMSKKKVESLYQSTFKSFAQYCQKLVSEGNQPASEILLEPTSETA